MGGTIENKDQRVLKLATQAKRFYEGHDPGHDWNHILRVKKLATQMQRALKADEAILMPAVILHDMVNLPKNDPNSSLSSEKSSKEAYKLLKDCSFNNEEISRISIVIRQHSYSRGEIPSSLEAEILQDADRLDALGGIGVLRCASVATALGSLFYHESDPWGKKRDLNDRKFMLDHYTVKLFKLPETMNTDWAKKEALKRVSFMKQFLVQIETEIGY